MPGGWIRMENERPEDEACCQNNEAQNWERNRRLKSGAMAKNSRKYIQDIVAFLWQEAKTADETLTFQMKEGDRHCTVRVSLGSETASGQGRTPKAAKEAAASAMLQQIGPYIEDAVYASHVASIEATVPQECRAWLPPVFDARHVAMADGGVAGNPNYEAEVTLGPLTAVSVTDNLETSLSSVIKHLVSFLKTRNLTKLASEPLEEDIGEMDVSPSLSQPYVQTPGLIDVRLEAQQNGKISGQAKDQILPPVDVYVMQENLPEGRFPPYYGNVDPWGYCKVFYCYRCMIKLNGVDTLIKHVKGLKHWRKIGKFFLKGQLRETFNPVNDPFVPDQSKIGPETEEEKRDRLASIPVLCRNCEDDGRTEIASGKCFECNENLCKECESAHGKTRITKGHKIDPIPPPLFKHPLKDQESGVKVEKDNIKYLIAVYRSSTGHPTQMLQTIKAQSLKAYPPPEQSAFPPPLQGAYAGHADAKTFASIGYVNPVEPIRSQFWGPTTGIGPKMGGPMGYSMGGGYGSYGPRFGQMSPQMFRGTFGQQSMGYVPRKSWGGGSRGGGGSSRRPPPATAQASKAENEDGNTAYSGKLGKRSITSKKMTPKFSALPPPGHEQWKNIPGNENLDRHDMEDVILPGIDNTRAHIPAVGEGFKVDKTGAKVCINWKRGLCKFGDRCIYLHHEPGTRNQVQAALDACIPPNERDMVGYRTRPVGQHGGGLVAGPDGSMVFAEGPVPPPPDREKPPNRVLEDDTSAWYNESGSSAVNLKVVDREAICRSIEIAKKATESFETDFTNIPKKSLRMDTEGKKMSRFND